jgi:membrane protein YqaA with SNARE-associated domain
MIAEIAGTVGIGFVSAFFPWLPAEPYVVGLVATTGVNSVVLGLAAGIGQSAGKLSMFLAARGTLQLPILRRRLARQRVKLDQRAATGEPRKPGRLRRAVAWVGRLLPKDKPGVGVAVLLLSAFAGIPPLIVMTFSAAASKMRTVVFIGTCLVGRTARMLVFALLPGLAAVVTAHL